MITVGSAFGTYALPYGKDFFAEPLTTLAIVLSIEFLIGGRCELAGVARGRRDNTARIGRVVAVLPIIVWVYRGFRAAFVYGSIAAIGAVVDAVYDQYRFGSVLKSGHGSEGFTTPFLHGAAGLLFSPRRACSFSRQSSSSLFWVQSGSGRRSSACRRSDCCESLGVLRSLGCMAFMARRLELGPAASSPGGDPVHALAVPSDQEGTPPSALDSWPPDSSCPHRRSSYPRGLSSSIILCHRWGRASCVSTDSFRLQPDTASTTCETQPRVIRVDTSPCGKSTWDSSAPRACWQVSPDRSSSRLRSSWRSDVVPIWRNHSPPGQTPPSPHAA